MLSINTNLPSLIAQRSLNNSTRLLNQAIERMSTGFKLNHAADNAANYSIVTNMNTKIGAYQVAEDNAAMGLDLISTASDSLDLINDKLVRLRSLAEQAANGTYGEQSLKAINAEANALIDEIQRSYVNTEYNGIKLFGTKESLEAIIDKDINGAPGGSIAGVDDTAIVAVTKRDTSKMTPFASVASNQHLAGGTYSISTMDELIKLQEMQNIGYIGADAEFVLANDINAGPYTIANGWDGIGRGAHYFTGTFDGNGYVIQNITINEPSKSEIGFFSSIGGTVKNLGFGFASVKGNDCVGVLAGKATSDAVIDNVYVLGGASGNGANVHALIGQNQGAKIGKRIQIIDDPLKYNDLVIVTPPDKTPDGADTGTITDILNQVQVNFNFQVGIYGNDSSRVSLNTAFALDVSALRGIGLDNNDYLSQIDNFINTVSSKQTDYGAAQNRLESALDEISTQYENLVSSRSTLRDADIAEVSSEYIRQQILQQASATLLATANQTPSLALQLL